MFFSFIRLVALLALLALAIAQITIPGVNDTVPYGDITDVSGLVDYAIKPLPTGLPVEDALIQDIKDAVGQL